MTPQQTPPDAVVAVAALGRALDAIISALASGSAARLIATEACLASAVADVSRIASVSVVDRPELRDELRRARLALVRCQSAGAVLGHVLDDYLAVRGVSNVYSRSGSVEPWIRRTPRVRM
jgi:hypothetical protein